MMRNNFGVLIGCCGGLAGVYLAKQFRRFHDFRIIGADAEEETVGRFFCDETVVLPSAEDEMFIDRLISVLKRKHIDIYIPTHSREVRKVSQYEGDIKRRTNAKFLVSPFETILDLDDKNKAYANMEKQGIPVPKVYDRWVGKEAFPLLKKPKIGSGGVGMGEIYDKGGFEEALRNPNLMVVQRIVGKEYTIDCMFSDKGELLGYNQRVRERCIGGAVSVSRNDYGVDVLPYIKRFMERWTFRGCVNFQYIKNNDKPYFIDVNLRCASGGLPLSVESGVDVPLAYRKILLGEKYGDGEFASDFKDRVMYRYFEERFCTG